MKIALIIDRFDANRGGAERYLCALAQFLQSKDDEPVLFSLDHGKEFPGRAVQVKGKLWPRGFRELVFSKNCERALAEEACDLSIAVRHVAKADIFQPHGGSIEGAWQGRLRSKRGWKRFLFRLGKAFDFKRLVLRRLEKKLMSSCRLVTVVSEFSAQEFRELYPEHAAKIRSIPLGVDEKRFSRQGDVLDLRTRIGAALNSKIALFVANDFELKGLEPALRSLVEKRRFGEDWRLIVVGKDPKRSRWEERVAKLELTTCVYFAGPVVELAAWYRGADLLIYPSFYDPFSFVVAEAQACGLTVESSPWVGVVAESAQIPTRSLQVHFEFYYSEMRKMVLLPMPSPL